MAKGFCPRHGGGHPCTCAMGNVYRFIEPVLLLMLRDKGHSYGYELSENLGEYALTDAQIERAALYRTLRTLEENGHVSSSWIRTPQVRHAGVFADKIGAGAFARMVGGHGPIG